MREDREHPEQDQRPHADPVKAVGPCRHEDAGKHQDRSRERRQHGADHADDHERNRQDPRHGVSLTCLTTGRTL